MSAIPKTITGIVDAWFTSCYCGPADMADDENFAVGRLSYSHSDMSTVEGWSRAGKATITVELLTADEMIGAKVEGLKAEKTKLMADHQQAITRIDSQIQQLLAITNEA